MKIPSITMTRYIRGETVTAPEALWDAMEDVGYPHIEQLIEAQSKWYS